MEATPTASEYTDTFVLQLYPYASVYLGAEGMLGGEARDRIAGFWRALGETPPPEPDHLAVMLAQYATLVEGLERETDAVRRGAIARARDTFLSEHLLSWLPLYLAKVAAIAAPNYHAWATLVLDVLAREAESIAGDTSLPLHLREAPPLPDPDTADRDTLIAGLLAPVRSGMIVTRTDLSRAARDTGLALRAGERRFQLNALLDQDQHATWSWLACEASDWVRMHRSSDATLGSVRDYWVARAKGAEQCFGTLAHHDESAILAE